MEIRKGKLYTNVGNKRHAHVVDIVEGAIIIQWTDRNKETVWKEQFFYKRFKPYQEKG